MFNYQWITLLVFHDFIELYGKLLKLWPNFVDHYSFEIAVPNGNYEYRLHFAELEYTEIGERVFDLLIEEELAIDDLDIVAEVGSKTALVVSGSITISDGTFNALFKKHDWDTSSISEMDAIVSGFELIPVD